jgi:hypothetical protein
MSDGCKIFLFESEFSEEKLKCCSVDYQTVAVIDLMPFEIEKGYGPNEIKKSVPHPVVRETDMVYISPAADLAELLNFKLYHISNKKKLNGGGKIQKRLVGEQYLRGEEVLGVVKKAKAKDVLNAGSSELQTYGHVKISNLLRKIRKLKVKKYSEQGHQKVSPASSEGEVLTS